MKLPVTGDRVLFVLRKLGAGVVAADGVTPQRKIRPAIVTEDWNDEPHPVDAQRKHKSTKLSIRGRDGKPFLDVDGVTPIVPAGTINLEIHLDGANRRDLAAGHFKYEADVQYDSQKGPGTWHWPGD